MTEYVIKMDGQVLRRDLSETPIALPQSFFEACSQNQARKFPALFEHPTLGAVGFTSNAGSAGSFVLQLKELQLRTHYQTSRGIMYPMFREGDGYSPITSIVWKSPETMRLLFYVLFAPYSGYGSKITAGYLFAMDTKGVIWRLPLPNLYDDCRVCFGESARSLYGAIPFKLVGSALTLLNNSPWNADLLKDQSKTHALFRFKAKEDGFESLACSGKWEDYCMKIANPLADQMAL